MRRVVLAAVVYALGYLALTILFLAVHGIDGEGDPAPFLLGFGVVFGLAIGRPWAIAFAAVHQIGWEYLGRHLSSDVPVYYTDSHPFEGLLLLVAGILAGTLARNWLSARAAAGGATAPARG